MAKASALSAEVLRSRAPLDDWDAFVDRSPQGCVFCRSWWLRAVCQDAFELLVLRRNGQIVAGFPLVGYTKYGFRALHMPVLTQTLGVLLAPPTSDNYERNLTNEMGILKRLVAAIPPVHHLNTFCHYTFTNWLPFHWAGYTQTTRYTYVIDDISDTAAVARNFAKAKRKNLRKAQEAVAVERDLPPDDFYQFHDQTLRKQGQAIFYGRDLFRRIHAAAREHDQGRIWQARDPDGNLHAAHFVLYDRRSAYYLISAIDPDRRASGAPTLLLTQTMEDLCGRTRAFDFEGSMLEGVELSARQFGARQRPYLHLHRNALPLWARIPPAGARALRAWRRARRLAREARTADHAT